MQISIVTLFPQMFTGPFDHSMVKKSIDKNLAKIEFVNIRDFGRGKHKVVDDKPYGGGRGMILRVDVLEKAINNTKNKNKAAKSQRVILLDPHGKTFNQKKAEEFSKLENLILICGHYEGIDRRLDYFVDEKISIGDFIVSGGEIPAMLITDAIIRLIKGSLSEEVTNIESFSPYLEYPQYTRPKVFKSYSVPTILLSGNHKKIGEWRKTVALQYTMSYRPDLLVKSLRPTKD